MTVIQQIARLRAKMVAKMGDLKRAVRILLAAGIRFYEAMHYVLGFA